MRNVVIVGCGYTGLRLGARLAREGCRVTGTARSESSATALRDAGIGAVCGDLGDRRTLADLAALEPAVIVYFVPPQPGATDPLPGVLEAFRACRPDAFVYASATSVYGDHGGDWVDEDTPVSADGIANEQRIDAERIVRAATERHGMPTRICRISGIYGPGRTLRGLLQSGHYTLIDGHDTWVGRIHVDDLVSGLVAAWQRGRDGRIYNMVDRRPHRASEFANLAADLHGLPRPRRIEAAEARRRYSVDEFRRKTANKRIRCARLVEELGVELRYPTFEQGLPAAVAQDRELQ